MIEPGQEHQQAVDLFNEVWALLDTADRGELDEARRHAEAARAICDSIDDVEDRGVVLSDLATLPLG